MAAAPDRLVLEAGDGRVEISPADGGRISSLTIRGRELLVTEGDGPIWWGAYPMAPYAGRVRNGEFRFRDRRWQLPANMPPHAIHGHVFDRPWTVDNPTTISIRLADPWPFAGSVVQRFDLAPTSLLVTMELHADEPMPASIGWHPWFRRPVELDLEADSMFVRDAEGIPTGELVSPPPGPWDDCFTNLRSDPRLRWPGGPELTIGSSCAYWVVLTERPHAVCVEPQTAPPNGLNLDPTIVEPGQPLIATMEWRWTL